MNPVVRRPSDVGRGSVSAILLVTTRELIMNRYQRTSPRGWHYSCTVSNPMLRPFVATFDADRPYQQPFIDTSVQFSNVNNRPIQSVVVSVDRQRYLVMGYFDQQLPQNLSLYDIFPHLAWHGEIVVFSLGRHFHILSRPAGARYMIHKAISL